MSINGAQEQILCVTVGRILVRRIMVNLFMPHKERQRILSVNKYRNVKTV